MCTQFGRTFTHQLATELQASRAWGLSRRKKAESPKKMDIHSSIITQVNRDTNEQTNGYTIQSKDEKKRSFRGTKTKTDTQRAQFRSLLCCFSRPKKKNVLDHKHVPESMVPTTNGRTDHTPPASPSQETNANDVSLSNGDQTYLLASKCPSLGDKKCAVIDLDETLVHSSFKPISNADFIVPVEIEGTIHQVYVLKRPHVDEYLKRMGELYECVLFTASLAKYADPVADLLDKGGVFSSRLFRESCVFHRGNYVKDLSLIGRDLHSVIIVDNSPASYIFHPDNAVPVVSWFDDPNDTELLDLIPFLEAIAKADDVYSVLNSQSFAHHTQKTSARLHQQQLIHQQQMQAQQQQCQTDTDDGDNEDRDSIHETPTAEQTIHQTSAGTCIGQLKAEDCSSTTNDCEPLIRPAVCNGSTPVTSSHTGSQEHGGPPTAPASD